MFCSHMCKDINDKNTKRKNKYQKHDSCFKTHKKMLEKHLKTWKLTLKLRKTIVTDAKYGETGATASTK